MKPAYHIRRSAQDSSAERDDDPEPLARTRRRKHRNPARWARPNLYTRRATILLAEDDRGMRQLMANGLRRVGYRVVEAVDGRDLQNCLTTGMLRGSMVAPDLIVSDVRMPGQSGLEVLRALRDTDWATPVILITAFGDRELHAEARRLGALAVVDKPFEISDLVRAVGAFLGPGIVNSPQDTGDA